MITSTPTSVILEFSLDTCWVDTEGTVHSQPALYHRIDGQPFYTNILLGVPSQADIDYYIIREQNIAGIRVLPLRADSAKGSSVPISVSPVPASGSRPFVSLQSGPAIKGNTSTTLFVHPQVGTDGQSRIISRATIQINWDEPTFTQPSLLSDTRFSHISSKGLIRSRSLVAPPEYQFSENLIRIEVDTVGWFHVPYSELSDSIENIETVNPQTFQLWEGNQEQLIYIPGEADGTFDPGDEIIFWGTPPDPPEDADYRFNFYTNRNVYWLTWGAAPGRRYISESGYPGQAAELTFQQDHYRQIRHIEKNEYFSRLGSMRTHEQWDHFDHYFMNPPIYAGNLESFLFELPAPLVTETSTALIRFAVQGITASTHSITFLLNDHLIGSGTWDNQENVILEFSLPQDLFLAGENSVTILNEELPDASNHYDMVLLNWIEVEYDRTYDAVDDKITFTRDGAISVTTQYEIRGFSSPDILLFKEGLSLIDDVLILESNGAYTLVFQDYASGQSPRFHAFDRTRLRPVLSIRREEPLPPPSDLEMANYYVIAPDSFRTILEPLITYHQATFVSVDWIYRNYSGGVLSPYAIKAFLSDRWDEGPSPLQYVLIAMQGKWMGWSGAPGFQQNYIPAMRIQTTGFGAVSSDYWYTLVAGDDFIPEFAIGRFPAGRKAELGRMVTKTLAALNRPPQIWNNRVLNIGGYEAVFKEQSETLIAREVNRGCFPIRLYIDRYSEGGPFYGTTDSLIHYFDRGLTYVNFFGHGGGAVWGDRSLLRLEDAERISNEGRVPFVTSMTCFTGDVTNPDALSRRMLNGEGGAVAWFGSSGVGWIINDFRLLLPIHEQLFRNEPVPLGDIINQGKIRYLAANTEFPDIALSQAYQFNLSGDPALTITLPGSFSGRIDPHDPEPDEALSLAGAVDTDSLTCLFYNDQYLSQNKYPEMFPGQFIIPEQTTAGDYYFTLRGKENNQWRSTTFPIHVSGTAIDWLETVPEYPNWTDSIQVRIRARDRQGIDSLWLMMFDHVVGRFQSVGNHEFILDRPLTGLAPLSVNPLIVKCRDGAGNISESSSQSIRVGGPLQVYVNGLELVAEDSIYLMVKTGNRNSERGDAVLSVYRLESNTIVDTLSIRRVSFSGLTELTTKIPVILPPGEHQFRAILEPVHQLAGTRSDTFDLPLRNHYFWSLPETGTTVDFTSHTVLRLRQASLEIAPQAHGQPVIFRFADDQPCKENFQTGLSPLSTATTLEGLSSIPFELTIIPDTTISDTGRLFRWYPSYNEWLSYESGMDNHPRKIFLDEDITIAYFSRHESEKPQLKASLNGQRFMRGMYVSRRPRIQITATDAIGVDPRVDRIFIWIDDVLGGEGIISNLAVQNGNLSFECQPDLQEDNRTLKVLLYDAAGTASDTLTLPFTVFNQLDLIDYGNFPNPFRDQTRFAYELTESVEKIYLDIYSIDGRHIRRFDEASSLTSLDPRAGAFHEIVWDGRDKNGDFVGNGVYFYRLVAEKGKRKLIRTGKVAKAR